MQLPINKLSDQLKAGVVQAGFTEALTFALVSQQFCKDFMEAAGIV